MESEAISAYARIIRELLLEKQTTAGICADVFYEEAVSRIEISIRVQTGSALVLQVIQLLDSRRLEEITNARESPGAEGASAIISDFKNCLNEKATVFPPSQPRRSVSFGRIEVCVRREEEAWSGGGNRESESLYTTNEAFPSTRASERDMRPILVSRAQATRLARITLSTTSSLFVPEYTSLRAIVSTRETRTRSYSMTTPRPCQIVEGGGHIVMDDHLGKTLGRGRPTLSRGGR
ncbi:hypothetical protein DFP72DRAFT_840645 [Ephemerocybe angulata]|uniref:Uncharacterized protein n=1 Tax=Ephemerocybe angulata TaxID=980116 RepID=A0A8H6IFD7_9AGAR|nr:hypothetical protein DFP72DRAFT_840645 [Tulosesus angulatus]